MKRCPKCGKEYGDDMLFCVECGEKLAEEQIRFCRNCGEKIRAGAAKCPKCGADLGVKKAETKKKKMPKAAVALVGGAVVLAAAAFAATGRLKTKKPSETADVYYYEKNDGDWYYYNADNDETGKAGSGVKPIVSEDGKKLFYTDGRTLMYRDLEKEKESEIVIDTNVIEYATDAKGLQVIYLKEDGGVYRNKLKKNNREHLLDLGEDEYFFASEDMEKLLLREKVSDKPAKIDFYSEIANEYDVFDVAIAQYSVYDIKNSRKERIPLDDILYACDWNSDFTRMYLWGADNNAYLYKDGSVTKIIDCKGNYYAKQQEIKTVADFVENDLTNAEMQQNMEKQQLWQQLNEEEVPVCSIYYFDGAKERKVAEGVIVTDWGKSVNADIYVVNIYNGPEKVARLSEVNFHMI